MLAEVMSLDEKHDGGIEFLVAIHDFNEVSRVLLCKDLNRGIEMNGKCAVTGVLTAKTYLSAGWRRSLSCSWAMSSKREGLRGSPPIS
jgi:hypothetical protein